MVEGTSKSVNKYTWANFPAYPASSFVRRVSYWTENDYPNHKSPSNQNFCWATNCVTTNSVVGSIDWTWETRLETNVGHRAGPALNQESATFDCGYNTELFSECFDFDSALLTAVLPKQHSRGRYQNWRSAKSWRRGRAEGLLGATLHSQVLRVEGTMSSLTESR